MVDGAEGFSLKDLADIVLKAHDSVNFYWNLYLLSVVAIFGWLLSRKDPPGTPFKLVVSIGLICFSIVICSGLKGSYSLREAARGEMAARINKDTFETKLMYDQITKRTLNPYPYLVCGVHAVVDSGLLIVIWSNLIWSYIRKEDATVSEPIDVNPNHADEPDGKY